MHECGTDAFMKERVGEWLIDSCERVCRETKEAQQKKVQDCVRNKAATTKMINNAALYNPK